MTISEKNKKIPRDTKTERVQIPYHTPTDKGKRGLSVSLWFEKNLIVWSVTKMLQAFKHVLTK